MEEQTQKRQVAKKVRLSDLKEGTYVRVEGEWSPNFMQTNDGLKFSRANIIAVVATEPVPEMNYNSFIVDDGSARVPVRIFGEQKVSVGLGDVVLIIGKPREFNTQIYLAPEIIKKIDNHKWVELRKIELERERGAYSRVIKEESETVVEQKPVVQDVTPEVAVATEEKTEQIVETGAVDDTEDKPLSGPVEKVIEHIQKLDSGDGADTEEVVSNSGIDNAEDIIENLLKEGEIFEITSGKVKVLE